MITIDHIPQQPGIYIFKNAKKEILYIGKAKNLYKRVSQYFTPASVRKQDMMQHATTVEFVHVSNESEALYLESNLIKQHKPHYNNLLKGDNHYCYIKIPREDFPPILITRFKTNDGAIYIGPKHHTKELRNFLQYLRLIYKYRTSKKTEFNKGQLGSDFYFGLDAGRSVFAKLKQHNAQQYIDQSKQKGLIIDQDYDYYKRQYQEIIKAVIQFFNGNTKHVEKDILTQIQNAIEQENFERAARLRDILTSINALAEKQTVEANTNFSGYIWSIKTVGERFVYGILHIYEGKIVDIIRHKTHQDDTDRITLISTLFAEYGDAQLRYQAQNRRQKRDIEDQAQQRIVGTTDIKKIAKKQLEQRAKMIDQNLEDFIIATSFEKESLMNELLKSLQEKYKLNEFPYRIECIDISHLSGGRMSGGLSCFVGGLRYTKGYRRYKIKSIKTLDQQNNDYQALQEVLIRRFTKSSDTQKPELMIIDGGKGQLGVVNKLLQENVKFAEQAQHTQFISLGKGDARDRKGKNTGATEQLIKLETSSHQVLGIGFQIINLSYDQTDQILTKARDEAHRFANEYRKKQMQKERQ